MLRVVYLFTVQPEMLLLLLLLLLQLQ